MTAHTPTDTLERTLRGVLRDLRAQADVLGVPEVAQGFAAIDERLRSRRLLVAVVGEHNRGKSSLINSLIGLPWLPVGQAAPALPPVYVFGGSREHVEVVYDDGSTAESTRAELLGLSLDDAASITYARVALPSPDLHGVMLVDTPGLNDPDTSRLAQTVYGLMPQSDLALLVLDSAQALGASEHDLVQHRILHAGLHRLVVVLNRDDDLEDEAQRAAVRERVVRLLAPLLGKEPEILPYAARSALRAREQNDTRLLSRTGYPELRALLRECAEARAGIMQDAALNRAQALARELHAIAGMPQTAPIAPIGEESEALAAPIETACRSLDTIREEYTLELRAFALALRDRLPGEIEEAAAEDIRRFLPFFIQDQYAGFLQEHEAAVMARVQTAVEDTGLADLPAISLAGHVPATGLHPYVEPDFLEDSLLVTTFMTVIGLTMRPIVAGAVMTLGPALRILTRDLRERDEHGALLSAAQAAALETGQTLEQQIAGAFSATTEAIRAMVRPVTPKVIESPVEDAARAVARERIEALLDTLTTLATKAEPAHDN